MGRGSSQNGSWFFSKWAVVLLKMGRGPYQNWDPKNPDPDNPTLGK